MNGYATCIITSAVLALTLFVWAGLGEVYADISKAITAVSVQQ